MVSSGWNTAATILGKLVNLEQMLRDDPLEGNQGIGHTRWATHGKPSVVNAHPHKAGPVSLVHNGIIENHAELAAELVAMGCKIVSETDTEIVAHLIERNIAAGADLVAAVRQAIQRLEGTYAFLVQSTTEPGVLVGARRGSPLCIGYGAGEQFVASDVQALISFTNQVDWLNDGEVVVLDSGSIRLLDCDGKPIARAPKTVSWNPIDVEKAGHKHFMHKEIFEQPRAITDSIEDCFSPSQGILYCTDRAMSAETLAGIKRVQLIACGTAFHACLVGKTYIERMARVACDADLASEFRYREPVISKDTLAVVVSQSGETADTLAAMREAKARGALTLAVVNVPGSTIAREVDTPVFTHAGPEVGVASTKAFTAQLVVLYLLAVNLGHANGTLSSEAASDRLQHLARVPKMLEEILAAEESIRNIAREFQHVNGFLFLGRGAEFPIALEGALKLKEISYLHAEGYAAGEMKHGPIALVDDQMLVVGLLPNDVLLPKMISNLQEVRARQGKVVVVAERGAEIPRDIADDVIWVPKADPLVMPILMAVPLQLLAYHVANFKGVDIDQPRNLAKSVTVE
jgi:glucosamine--fructose-6-phosphate aminotransferase (isomerizing)